MTNVGSLDGFLAPLGDKVRDAWMVPPTFPGFPAPVALVTSFKDRLTVGLGSSATLNPADVEAVAAEWTAGIERRALSARGG